MGWANTSGSGDSALPVAPALRRSEGEFNVISSPTRILQVGPALPAGFVYGGQCPVFRGDGGQCPPYFFSPNAYSVSPTRISSMPSVTAMEPREFLLPSRLLV